MSRPTVVCKEDEIELINNILAGNKEDYAVLVNRYKNLAFTLARRVLQNQEDAEEATQEAFIKAYKNLGKFRKEAGFSSWLYRIVYNEAINLTRKEKKTEEFIVHKHEGYTPADQMDKQERTYIIEKAISKLPDIDRAVVTLFYLEEMNIREVATTLNMNQNNVKIRLFRSRKRLAEILMKAFNTEKIIY